MRRILDCSWRLRLLVAFFMVGAVLVSGASAAEITWLPRIDASTNLPVNNGHVIEAVNAAGPAIVINGINFKEGILGTSITNSNAMDAYDNCCSGNGAPTGASPEMATMLNSHLWKSGRSVATLILNGLTAGNDYMIQLYFSDFRPGSFKQYVWAGDNASLSEPFTRGTTVDNWSFIGNFRADSDKQRVMQIPLGTRITGFVNHDPGLSGYVLSSVPSASGSVGVPEPDAAPLVAVFGIGIALVAFRRRHRLVAVGAYVTPWIALAIVSTFAPTKASAAPVTWLPKIDAATNLPVNNGNVIEAVNAAGPEIVINGITFKEGILGNGIAHSNIMDAFDNCCSDNGGPTGANAAMSTMLNSHLWKSGASTIATLRLQDLAVGTRYTIQTYFTDVRGPNDHPKTYFWMDDHGNHSQTWKRNGQTPDNVSFIGSFTADNPLQNIHMVSDGIGIDGFENHDPGISGYVLSRVVSQPGDFDGDGDRDGNDFLVWQRGPATQADFNAWSSNFGSSSPAFSAIPEPATSASFALTLSLVWLRRFHGRR